MILHLKEDAKDFAAPWRIKDIVRRFSSFVPHPIRLGEGGEILNDQKPIWVEPKSQVTDEQYREFYRHLTHHTEESPLCHAGDVLRGALKPAEDGEYRLIINGKPPVDSRSPGGRDFPPSGVRRARKRCPRRAPLMSREVSLTVRLPLCESS